MPPRVERRSGNAERTVVIGCIVSRAVLGPIAARWEPGLFPSRWATLVVGWCISHYERYRRAPGADIAGYFDAWAESAHDPETVAIVESLLRGLSDEYEHLKKTSSPDYILDMAATLFERARLAELAVRVSAYLEDGEVVKARELVETSRRVEIGLGAGINVLSDAAAFDSIFITRGPALIEYPDALANFFVPAVMQRDTFLAFMGAEKRGKSWWLQDMAWRAVEQNRRVAYFEVGDSSQPQVLARFATRIMGRPLAAGRYQYPTDIESSGNKKLPIVKTDMARLRDDITPEQLHAERERVMGLYGHDVFKLSCHPNSSISVTGISAVLETWERDGWNPDCIAEGSLVLTHRGLVPIESVLGSDRLWDGCNWVSHGGVVCKGVRDVITYAGVTATADHQVWTDHGWRSLESCKRLRLRIANTESDGNAIRVGENYITGDEITQLPIQEIREDIYRASGICSRALCEMRHNKMGEFWQHSSRCGQGVSFMPTTKTIPTLVVRTDAKCKGAMYRQRQCGMAPLWRTGDSVSVQNSVRCMCLDCSEFRDAEAGAGNRPHRQQWALRTGQFAIVNPTTKLFPHMSQSTNTTGTSVRDVVSGNSVCTGNPVGVFQTGNDTSTNHRTVECNTETVRKTRVWDIVNAGPLHRFTVSGVLVHNCVFVDYADILAPINTRVERRDQINDTWKALRGLSQRLHCLVVTATQTDADAYDTWLLRRDNFSEDKRKYAHVNGMVGINQTAPEKELGLYRLNWVVGREFEYAETKFVWTAGSLAYANPCMFSCF